MGDRRVEIDRLRAAQGHGPKLTLACLPIQRCAPTFIERLGPAVGQPQQRVAIPAVRDEFNPLSVRYQSVGQTIRVDLHGMPRSFAVESKSRSVVSYVE